MYKTNANGCMSHAQHIFNEDSLLWKAFKAGNDEAFEKIYRKEIQGLIQYGKKISTDLFIVQDAIQDLFVELWNSRERLSDTDNIRFYLLRALRNKLSKKVRVSIISDYESEEDATEPSFEFKLLENELEETRQKCLKNAISKLSRRQQEAINLRYFHDLSNEEIAEIMGVNYQSACKFIYSGLKLLRENIFLETIILLFFRGL